VITGYFSPNSRGLSCLGYKPNDNTHILTNNLAKGLSVFSDLGPSLEVASGWLIDVGSSN
jgi:hypothetical protein